jgi:hypothetical protein
MNRDRALMARFLAEVEAKCFFKYWPPLGPATFAGWGWGHAAAYHMGLFRSPKMRFPMVTLTPEHVAGVKAQLEELRQFERSVI